MSTDDEHADLRQDLRVAFERLTGPSPTIEWRDPERRTKRGATTITEFLLARIAEDEEAAARHQDDADRVGLGSYTGRVLAECAAKRAIVERYTTITETTRQAAANYQAWLDNTPDPYPGVSSREHTQDVAAELETVLHHLATVYADYPDYREEWKP